VWFRRIATVVLGVLFVVAFVLYLAQYVIVDRLLNGSTYASVLHSQKIYQRLYDDVLTDPELSNLTERMLAGTSIVGSAEETAALTKSAIRNVLPASQVQAAAEGTVNRVAGFLSGDATELDTDTGLSNVFAGDKLGGRMTGALGSALTDFDSAAGAGAAGAGTARAGTAATAAVPLNLETLRTYMDGISAGTIDRAPSELTAADIDALSDSDRRAVVDVLLGEGATSAPALLRQQIDAALVAGDLRSAMAIGARERLGASVGSAADGLAREFAGSGLANSAVTMAALLNQTSDNVIAGLNRMRNFISLLNTIQPILVLVMLLSLLLIIVLHRGSVRGMMRAGGGVLLAAGLSMLLGWFVFGATLRAQIPALDTGGAGVIPATAAKLVADVIGALGREFFGAFLGWTLSAIALGAGLILLSFSNTVVTTLRRWFDPLGRWRWVPFALVGALIVLLLPLTRDAAASASSHGAKPALAGSCNGRLELCDRRVNEVAYPTTHNSMSISQYGWLWPTHDGTITDQLEFGIRGFLIDTHYFDVSESVRSYKPDAPEKLLNFADAIVARAAKQVIEGTFTCHMVCPIGSTPLPDTLAEVRAFLDRNPREVLIFAIEDKISAEDTVKAFDAADLTKYVYTHTPGRPWPTLRQMIEQNKRLIVMAEVKGPPPDWYAHVWDYTMETPYSFKAPEEFSCEPNRGDEGKDFFLLNHWIERVSPSRLDAAVVNRYDVLRNRALRCMQERGKMPNLIGVNFYLNGDLLQVVDELNGMVRP
jgi:hypothetical protein